MQLNPAATRTSHATVSIWRRFSSSLLENTTWQRKQDGLKCTLLRCCFTCDIFLAVKLQHIRNRTASFLNNGQAKPAPFVPSRDLFCVVSSLDSPSRSASSSSLSSSLFLFSAVLGPPESAIDRVVASDVSAVPESIVEYTVTTRSTMEMKPPSPIAVNSICWLLFSFFLLCSGVSLLFCLSISFVL